MGLSPFLVPSDFTLGAALLRLRLEHHLSIG
jgi:hypothetical protein